MQVPLQIAFHGHDQSESCRDLIEEKVSWLEHHYDRITSCRVVIESAHHHHLSSHYAVRITLSLPGAEIVLTRDSKHHGQELGLDETINNAFDAVRRQLEQHVQRHRNEIKTHEPAARARVERIYPEEGYGFLGTLDGREIYFHHHAMTNGKFQHLKVGDEVVFVEQEGEKGPQASTVRLVGRHNH